MTKMTLALMIPVNGSKWDLDMTDVTRDPLCSTQSHRSPQAWSDSAQQCVSTLFQLIMALFADMNADHDNLVFMQWHRMMDCYHSIFWMNTIDISSTPMVAIRDIFRCKSMHISAFPYIFAHICADMRIIRICHNHMAIHGCQTKKSSLLHCNGNGDHKSNLIFTIVAIIGKKIPV